MIVSYVQTRSLRMIPSSAIYSASEGSGPAAGGDIDNVLANCRIAIIKQASIRCNGDRNIPKLSCYE